MKTRKGSNNETVKKKIQHKNLKKEMAREKKKYKSIRWLKTQDISFLQDKSHTPNYC